MLAQEPKLKRFETGKLAPCHHSSETQSLKNVRLGCFENFVSIKQYFESYRECEAGVTKSLQSKWGDIDSNPDPLLRTPRA